MDVNAKCRIQAELDEILNKYDGLSDDTVMLMTIRRDDAKQLGSLLSRIHATSKEVYITHEIMDMMSEDDGLRMIQNDIAMALGHELVNSGMVRFITDNNIQDLKYIVRGTVIGVLPPEDNTYV